MKSLSTPIPEHKPENRERGARSLDKFVNIFLLQGKSEAEAISEMRSLSSEHALGLLDRLNRALTGRQESIGEEYNPEVTVGGFFVPDGQIKKPKHFRKIFDTLWESIKREPELEILADKLMLSIIYLHIFEDGNGRTARYVWLMINKLAENEFTKEILVANERPAALQSFFEWLDEDAIDRMFLQAGLNNSVIKRFTMRKASLDILAMDAGLKIGTRAPLKFIAAHRAGLVTPPEGYTIDQVFAVDAKGHMGLLDKPFDHGGVEIEVAIQPWNDEEIKEFEEELVLVEEDFVYSALEAYSDENYGQVVPITLKMILTYKAEISPFAWELLVSVSRILSGKEHSVIKEGFNKFLNRSDEEIEKFIADVTSAEPTIPS